MAATTTPPKPQASSSLYVGDLNSEVTEGALFDIFNQVGPVASIRVCRDTLTRRSLGYAYVNFHSADDAERALDTLNNTFIKGRACRIMWSQRDPSVRKSGVGNIFIKNLEPAMGHKELHDTFSPFGNILSCKVATDDKGNSKGYGFVHFETAEAADSAIQMVNDMMIGSKKVFVGHFRARKEREQEKETSWTNIYVKDIDESMTDDQLKELFGQYGPISSAIIMRDENGASKGFGFINFDRHEDAVKAVENLHQTTHGSKKLWAGRAQKKSERQIELRKKHEQLKMDRLTKYQGINLYLKNLEDDVTEDRLKKEFSTFGEIKSVKIMGEENGHSRGFGFVCFSTPEEAQRAITEMNGRILQGCTKPLYVALHEPKEMRRHKLAARAASARGGKDPRGGLSQQVPPMFPPGTPPVYYPPGAQGFVYPQSAMMPAPARNQRWNPQQAYPQMPPSYLMPMRGTPMPAAGTPPGQPPVHSGVAPAQGGNPRSRNAGGRGANAAGSNGRAPAGGPPAELSLQYLGQFPPEQQKNIIGERLYRLIERSQPQLTGKITGMFLAADWAMEELLSLTQNEEKLAQKVDEAVTILQQATQENAHAEAQ